MLTAVLVGPDAASIASAIKGLKHMTSDDARTIIAALSARLIQIQDCDNGDCIAALDEAHGAKWIWFDNVWHDQLDDSGVTGIKR